MIVFGGIFYFVKSGMVSFDEVKSFFEFFFSNRIESILDYRRFRLWQESKVNLFGYWIVLWKEVICIDCIWGYFLFHETKDDLF